jgi:hypothetical protein
VTTIIGFVGFVGNLVNTPTDGATVSVQKKSYFSSACEYVKLPFSLRVPKKSINKIKRYIHFWSTVKNSVSYNAKPHMVLLEYNKKSKIFDGKPSSIFPKLGSIRYKNTQICRHELKISN